MGNLFSKGSQSSSGQTLGKRSTEDLDEGAAKRQRCQDFTPRTEQDAGITAFVNPSLSGFHGIIKFRAEDFVVHEIDLDGNVVTLTTMEPPQLYTEAPERIDEETFYNQVNALFGQEITDSVRAFLSTDRNDTEACLTFETSRDSRIRMYKLLEKYLGPDKPVSLGEFGKISLRWPRPDDEYEEKEHPDFEKLGGNYLQFVVHKSGIDTMGAVNKISKYSDTLAKHLCYAGTKDARAITTQAFTVYKSRISRFIKAQEELKKHNIYIGNFQFVQKGLTLGDLSGNRFTIVLRDVTGIHEQQLTKSLESLGKNGFINYFGMQRFGTSAIMTHEIGREILNKNYKEAADLILKPRPGDRDDFDAARKHWQETGDPAATADMFPRGAMSETSILRSYVRNPGHHEKAIQSIPSKMLSMYSHAYQSYIWNKVVSERAKRFGCSKVLVGDLVLVDPPAPKKTKDKHGKNAKKNNAGRRDHTARKVPKILTEEDVDNYTIFDIVYPVPGRSSVYPANEMGEVYKQLLDEDGVTFGKGLHGDYRPMMAKPNDLVWSLIRYNDPTEKLENTDVDKLNNKPEPENVPDGKHLALRLSFNLGTSQYATMALREILRSDTSSRNQATFSHT